MNGKLLIYILQIKTYIQNLLRSIISHVYVTKSISVLCENNNQQKNVYYRYLALKFLMLIKFLLLDLLYQRLCNYIDIDAEYIHITKNINYVDRSFIYNNTTKTHSIMNVLKELENYEKCPIELCNQIVSRCELDNGFEKINLKDIFSKYVMNNDDHNVRSILLFNNIQYNDNTKINIAIMRLGIGAPRYETKNYNVIDILDKKIIELY